MVELKAPVGTAFCNRVQEEHRIAVMSKAVLAFMLLSALAVPAAQAQSIPTEDAPASDLPLCLQVGPEVVPPAPVVEQKEEPSKSVLDRLADFAAKHKLRGLASYYSSFFDGRKTANGEIYRNAKMSAAHLTLPLGTWIEVKSIATGRSLRLRVNDRGPYTGGFVLDLSQAAARAIGVDRAADRRVEIRLLALPGQELPKDNPVGGTQPEVVAAK